MLRYIVAILDRVENVIAAPVLPTTVQKNVATFPLERVIVVSNTGAKCEEISHVSPVSPVSPYHLEIV